MSNFYRLNQLSDSKSTQTETHHSQLIQNGANSLEIKEELLRRQLELEEKARDIANYESILIQKEEDLRERKCEIENLESEAQQRLINLASKPLSLITSPSELKSYIKEEKSKMVELLYTRNLFQCSYPTFSNEMEEIEKEFVSDDISQSEIKRRIHLLKSLEQYLLEEFQKLQIANDYLQNEYKLIFKKKSESLIHNPKSSNILPLKEISKFNNSEEVEDLREKNEKLIKHIFLLEEQLNHFSTKKKNSPKEIINFESSAKPLKFENPYSSPNKVPDFSNEIKDSLDYSGYIEENKRKMKLSKFLYKWMKFSFKKNKDKKGVQKSLAFFIWKLSTLDIRKGFLRNEYLDNKWRDERIKLMKKGRFPVVSMSKQRRNMELELFELERENFFHNKIKYTLTSVFRNQIRRQNILKLVGFYKFCLSCFLKRNTIKGKDHSNGNEFITMFKEVLIKQDENPQKAIKGKFFAKKQNSKIEQESKKSKFSHKKIFLPLILDDKIQKIKLKVLLKMFSKSYFLSHFSYKQEISDINLVLLDCIQKSQLNMHKSKVLIEENTKLIDKLK